MNYAALLAVMVMLAFCFPMAVRLGEYLGLSAGAAAVTLWSLLIFTVAFMFVRWRVALEREREAMLKMGRERVLAHPTDAAAYFVQEQHLALLLLERGRRREAAEMVDRYAQLAGATDADILMLREALSSADRWRFKRQPPVRPSVRELWMKENAGEQAGADTAEPAQETGSDEIAGTIGQSAVGGKA